MKKFVLFIFGIILLSNCAHNLSQSPQEDSVITDSTPHDSINDGEFPWMTVHSDACKICAERRHKNLEELLGIPYSE